MSKNKIAVILLATAVLIAGAFFSFYDFSSNKTFDTVYELCGEPDDVIVNKDSMLVIVDDGTDIYAAACVLEYMNVQSSHFDEIKEREYFGQPRHGYLEVVQATDANRFKISFVMSEHGDAFLFEPVGGSKTYM